MLALEQNYAQDDHEATLNFQSARDDIKSKARGTGRALQRPTEQLALSGRFLGVRRAQWGPDS